MFWNVNLIYALLYWASFLNYSASFILLLLLLWTQVIISSKSTSLIIVYLSLELWKTFFMICKWTVSWNSLSHCKPNYFFLLEHKLKHIAKSDPVFKSLSVFYRLSFAHIHPIFHPLFQGGINFTPHTFDASFQFNFKLIWHK